MGRIKIGFIILVGLMLTTTLNLKGQTKKEAADAYNLGVAAQTNNNLDSAIIYFTNSIALATKVGDDASDVLNAATAQLPGIYYKKAVAAYKAKNYEDAISLGKLTIKVAEQYKNESKISGGEKILVLSYNSIGNSLSGKNDFQNAVKYYDSALLIDPFNVKASFNKAICYSKLDDQDKFVMAVDSTIAKAKGDTSLIGKCKILAFDFFLKKGESYNLAGKLTDALQEFTLALNYKSDKNLMYQFADVYNKQKKYDEAITSAQKGLDLETGDANAKAKFYYEIALAQVGKGDKDNACDSFKNQLMANLQDHPKLR